MIKETLSPASLGWYNTISASEQVFSMPWLAGLGYSIRGWSRWIHS